MKLTRAEIVRKLAGRIDINPKQAAKATEALFYAITQALGAGEEVRLQHFGRFFLKPKRAGARASVPKAKAVAFRGFGRLRKRINAPLDDLETRALTRAPLERRGASREEPLQDGTAIVRISGIPICRFRLKSVSEGGTSFWVREDSVILRNIRVGQEIDIRIHNGPPAVAAAMFRSRIVHITKSDSPETKGYFILGVQILDKV
ncbi:MAG: HU family DNA-binding protein [Desulfobacteraceae bacterium]|nr:MAG: HU family DNA-binding protein [Desulfobacteraceae bacterium]